ncbi:MAG: class I SAM-dependent methyltransferase [Anaerolineae bacterium]|nr:class I SAM-dependent methyltransferase [Anaerolineae bacterium]
MLNDNAVAKHYTRGNLLNAIQKSLAGLGKTAGTVTIDDLAAIDEFHIGGRYATERLLNQLNLAEHDHILDVGCGLGGAARFAANTYNIYVTGIDVTAEYIETGKALCAWVGLDEQVTLRQGDVMAMSFEDETFDGGFMMHVGMNIENKHQLFREIYRVMRPGTVFGVYDIMQVGNGELAYPVPWATVSSTSRLATPQQYNQALAEAGFKVSPAQNYGEYALDFFQRVQAKTRARGLPPLGLHTLIGESMAVKFQNMIAGIKAGHIAPVEIIAQKS